MKLTFFLIAFCLVFVRAYFSWPGNAGKGKDDVTITIENGDDYEQIKYGGKIVFTEDETAVKSISPGGFIKYRKNDVKLAAESNVVGEISYTISNDGNKYSAINENGKKIITEAVKEIIAYGFEAKERMERIYRKGGRAALLNEMGNLKAAGVTGMYMDRLFKDSLTVDDYTFIANKIKALGSDIDKVNVLNKYTVNVLQNPQIALPWFDAVTGLNADIDKMNALGRLVGSDTVSTACFDKVLDISSHLNADVDKGNMYKKLMEQKNVSEQQWVTLINHIQQISADIDKSNLLVQIAQKAPKTKTIKTAYLKVAKTINNDADYGKAIRAIE